MSTSRLPCVDGSGRGLDDGECVHCGDSGNIDNRECAARLREALDAWDRTGASLAQQVASARLDRIGSSDPRVSGFVFNVGEEVRRHGHDPEPLLVRMAKERAGFRGLEP